jgi:hypothetical protein
MGTGCCKEVRPENAARMFRNPAPVLLNGAVASLLNRKRPMSILEVGAGCLRNALYLLKMGHFVSVLEVPQMEQRFPEQYQLFRRLGGTRLKNLANAPSFELVVITFVVETICSPHERVGLLRGVCTHLKSGGVLVLSARGPRDLLTANNHGVRCGDGYLTPNRSFARSYTRRQMERLLRATGFTDLYFLHKSSSKEPEYLHVLASKKSDE